MAEVSEAALAAHEDAERRGAPGYLDPDSGLFVMTRSSLAARGECCGRGCRHCPYPEEERLRAGRPPDGERSR